jgi:signal recognition particle receptor subunit beta
MEPLYVSTEGMSEAEELLLSMILSFASEQLHCNWIVKDGGDVHAVIYDFTNPRTRLAWERNQSLTHPVPVVLSEELMPGLQWVLQKPIRTHNVIPLLNNLSGWMAQSVPHEPERPASYRPQADPFSSLKTRLTSVASQRLSQAGALKEVKLIIAGSVAAGKTTAIKMISDIPPIRTDVEASDHVAQLKAQTTVAMDYGEVSLMDGQKLRIYGTPGQRRYDFMSKILCRGALGLVVLLDNRVENPWSEIDYYSYVFSDLINESAMVFGVTHLDEAPVPGLEKYERYLRVLQKPWPVFPIDPRNKSDVVTVLDALVTMLEHGRRPHAISVGRH